MKVILYIVKFPFAIILAIAHRIITGRMEYQVLKSTETGVTELGSHYIIKNYIVYQTMYHYIMHRKPEPQITIKHTQFVNP